LRSNPEATHKTRRVFGLVQAALGSSVDKRLLTLIEASQTGVKIVADALLEWLPVRGLPLGLRYDVSRINATPGSLTFGELINPAPIYLEPAAFSEVLVLSAFDADDPIKDHLRDVLQIFEQDGILKPRVVEIRTIDAMVSELNSFRGAVAIFGGHGVHNEDDVGFLQIGDERLDVWQLRKRARVPPVVLLSACDTNALDRSHATKGNGFLSCGARAVLATVLPVRSVHSAAMIGRLLLRAVEFSKALHSGGRAITWAYIVSTLFRLQITSDNVIAMFAKNLLVEKAWVLHVRARSGAKAPAIG
jgi:CHAT domain-containing protein